MALRNIGDPTSSSMVESSASASSSASVSASPSSFGNLKFDPVVFLAESSVRQKDPYVVRFHQEKLPEAVEVVEKSLKKYSLFQLAIAFNGGKDCTALLDLVLKSIENEKKNSNSNSSSPFYFPIIYFRSRKQFSDLENFIEEKIVEISRNFSTKVKLSIYEGDLKDSLARFKKENPLVEGIFMGTRCEDPSSKNLFFFSPTDPSWPNFMRILPILHFSYHDVWLYLKELNVSYCKLYDDGYTSIGWEGNTFPNPKLKTVFPDGNFTYRPAFLLENSDDERSARE